MLYIVFFILFSVNLTHACCLYNVIIMSSYVVCFVCIVYFSFTPCINYQHWRWVRFYVTGNHRDVASRCDMWLLLRHILRTASDDYRSDRSAPRLRVHCMLSLRVRRISYIFFIFAMNVFYVFLSFYKKHVLIFFLFYVCFYLKKHL